MPYALVLIGLLLIVTGILNTYAQFAAQFRDDLTGGSSGFTHGFIAWVTALFAVGALGYLKDFRTFSHYFMALILISMIISASKQGFWAQLKSALASGPKAPAAAAAASGASTPTFNQVDGTVKDLATGSNPGSDTLGSITAPFSSAVRSFLGLSNSSGAK